MGLPRAASRRVVQRAPMVERALIATERFKSSIFQIRTFILKPGLRNPFVGPSVRLVQKRTSPE